MHIKKSLFRYKMCHNLKNAKVMKEKISIQILSKCSHLHLLKICAKLLGKVTRNKEVLDKKSQPITAHKMKFSIKNFSSKCD